MSTTDCRTSHIYRLPVHQKRVTGIDKYISNPHTRSPSPNKAAVISRRRHSTPPISAKRLIDIKPPQSSTTFKYYHPNTRPTWVNKEQNPISDSVKSPPRPISLVKQRRQEERVVRIATTPSSINPMTDIILPIAKKNRNIIVEPPSPIISEIQSIDTTKRGKSITLDLEPDIFVSEEDHSKKSLRDDTSKLKSTKGRHGKWPCRFPLCHWYCSCPFCCLIPCFFLALALFIGIFITMRFFSN